LPYIKEEITTTLYFMDTDIKRYQYFCHYKNFGISDEQLLKYALKYNNNYIKYSNSDKTIELLDKYPDKPKLYFEYMARVKNLSVFKPAEQHVPSVIQNLDKSESEKKKLKIIYEWIEKMKKIKSNKDFFDVFMLEYIDIYIKYLSYTNLSMSMQEIHKKEAECVLVNYNESIIKKKNMFYGSEDTKIRRSYIHTREEIMNLQIKPIYKSYSIITSINFDNNFFEKAFIFTDGCWKIEEINEYDITRNMDIIGWTNMSFSDNYYLNSKNFISEHLTISSKIINYTWCDENNFNTYSGNKVLQRIRLPMLSKNELLDFEID
jgi:hypothetical protein